jgi:repressor of nif and glnA expression
LIQGASERERQLLKILAASDYALEWKAITALVKKSYKTFPAQSVGKFLSKLLEKGLIQQPKRGISKLPDRIFEEYIFKLK